MLRLLLRLLLLLVVLALLAAAIGPLLLIDPNPAPGVTRPADVAPADSRFVEVPFADGTLSMHYLARNLGASAPNPTPDAAGPTFVLLHGFTFNAFTWDGLLDFLAGYGPVLAYDQVPYGLSAKPLPLPGAADHPYTKAAALAQLFALLDTLGIERAILVGNSSGGTLALEAARAAPERVQGLILIAPWVHSKRPMLPAWLAALPQMQRISLALARKLGGTSPLLDYSYADPTRIDERRRTLTGVHRLVANWDAAWAALLGRSLSDPVEIASQLGEITQPTLVITGAEDRVVPVADTEATAAALPNATIAVLPGCGHLPQEECPQAVADVIAQWLAGDGARPN